MAFTAAEHIQQMVKLVQMLLPENRSDITPAIIGERIDMALLMKPEWRENLDRDAVTDELIRRSSIQIGQDATLKSDEGHIPWLNSSRKQNWLYWKRYSEWLEEKISLKAIEALDKSTNTILELLEDPQRGGAWDRRGLVVGHVQSGKTGNYTGLICKAADAGYKIIIVLAGLHNNLRSQTQMRLDEGFLGFETGSHDLRDARDIGVGEIDSDHKIRPNYATNRTEKGDFSARIAKNLGITPEQRPWLFVVKKNKSVLERLFRWIRDHAANSKDPETGMKIVTHLPLMIIDDEADHASVDTRSQIFDGEGAPDKEHEPTAINSCIRKILNSFSRSAYVGYTATPFANIFIHERGETIEEGQDLFPSSFIVNLAAPSNYVGPAKVFGVVESDGTRSELPLIRTVDDYATNDGRNGWMPHRHRSTHIPVYDSVENMPTSLVEAIDAFILACAARHLRGQGHDHSSMLIHVTRFNAVQQHVHQQVDEYVSRMRQRIQRKTGHQEIIVKLKHLWETDFERTTAEINLRGEEKFKNISWDEILTVIENVIGDIKVKMINGSIKDALDYVEHNGVGLKVIAIGGDKLARGLTLEGLCVSYFLRATKMYDTLMQMGRWFGYRPGYLDLSRLYTTVELAEWFGHIADASEELREEFDLMAASGATPRDYGLKVQSHPVLMVTSRLKMRTAQNLRLSFSGQILETVALHNDPAVLSKNYETLTRLIEGLNDPDETDPERDRADTRQKWSGYVWNNVAYDHIVDFLVSYKTHPEAHKVKGDLLAEFIQRMAAAGELTHWTVALIGGGEGEEHRISNDLKVKMSVRSDRGSQENRYSIGRLLSPRDEGIDLDETAWKAAFKLTVDSWRGDPARVSKFKEPDRPNGPSIRKIRGFGAEGVQPHPERGLLLLYLLNPKSEGSDFSEAATPVVAFAASFPASNSGLKVEYKVNNVLWEQEYGAAE